MDEKLRAGKFFVLAESTRGDGFLVVPCATERDAERGEELLHEEFPIGHLPPKMLPRRKFTAWLKGSGRDHELSILALANLEAKVRDNEAARKKRLEATLPKDYLDARAVEMEAKRAFVLIDVKAYISEELHRLFGDCGMKPGVVDIKVYYHGGPMDSVFSRTGRPGEWYAGEAIATVELPTAPYDDEGPAPPRDGNAHLGVFRSRLLSGNYVDVPMKNQDGSFKIERSHQWYDGPSVSFLALAMRSLVDATESPDLVYELERAMRPKRKV